MSARGARLVDDWFDAGHPVIVADIPEPLMVPVPVPDDGHLLIVVVPESVPVRYRADVAASVIAGWLRDQHPEPTWKAMVRGRLALRPGSPALAVVRETLAAAAPPAGSQQADVLAAYDAFHTNREASRRAARWALGLAAASDDGDGGARDP